MGYCNIYMLVLPCNQVQTKKLIAICSGLQLTKVLNKIVEATDSFFFDNDILNKEVKRLGKQRCLCRKLFNLLIILSLILFSM